MTRRKRYSAEFKREALRRANEEGVTDTLVAEDLGFSTRQLRRWRDDNAHGTPDGKIAYATLTADQTMTIEFSRTPLASR